MTMNDDKKNKKKLMEAIKQEKKYHNTNTHKL